MTRSRFLQPAQISALDVHRQEAMGVRDGRPPRPCCDGCRESARASMPSGLVIPPVQGTTRHIQTLLQGRPQIGDQDYDDVAGGDVAMALTKVVVGHRDPAGASIEFVSPAEHRGAVSSGCCCSSGLSHLPLNSDVRHPSVSFPSYSQMLAGKFPSPQSNISWPYEVDCTPPYLMARVLSRLDINWTCGGNAPGAIRQSHASAYRLAKTALRTVRFIATHPSISHRVVLWNWGNAEIAPGYAWMWNLNLGARFASLAHWFGPFSDYKLAQILGVFGALVDWYENGPTIAGHHHPIRYWCSINNSSCTAIHAFQGVIELCLPFWEGNARRRAAVLLHEPMHGVVKPLMLRDEKHYHICASGVGRKCYRNFVFDSNDPWIYGEDDDDVLDRPRRLVRFGAFSTAINNIDNYVSWALRRWDDPQFGECNAPRRLGGKPPK